MSAPLVFTSVYRFCGLSHVLVCAGSTTMLVAAKASLSPKGKPNFLQALSKKIKVCRRSSDRTLTEVFMQLALCVHIVSTER